MIRCGRKNEDEACSTRDIDIIGKARGRHPGCRYFESFSKYGYREIKTTRIGLQIVYKIVNCLPCYGFEKLLSSCITSAFIKTICAVFMVLSWALLENIIP